MFQLLQEKVKTMLSGATMKALQTWDIMSRPVQTTVAALLDSVPWASSGTWWRGGPVQCPRCRVIDRGFGGPGHLCNDSAWQVSAADGGAVVADFGTAIGGTATDTTVHVRCQILRIGPYFYFHGMVAVRDMSFAASTSSLLQVFSGLYSESVATAATPAGNICVGSILCSALQEASMARQDLCSVMRSMGVFGGGGHRCGSSASHVAVADGGAAFSDCRFATGAAAIETNVGVDSQFSG